MIDGYITAGVTDAEKAIIAEAADAMSMSVSQFVRAACLEDAKRVMDIVRILSEPQEEPQEEIPADETPAERVNRIFKKHEDAWIGENRAITLIQFGLSYGQVADITGYQSHTLTRVTTSTHGPQGAHSMSYKGNPDGEPGATYVKAPKRGTAVWYMAGKRAARVMSDLGKTDEEIAETLGIAVATASRWVEENVYPYKVRITHDDRMGISDLYFNEGMSIKVIADAIGIGSVWAARFAGLNSASAAKVGQNG